MKKLSPRSKAKLNGSAFYYSDSTCKNGHTSKRRTDSGQCVECANIRRKRIYHEQKKDCSLFDHFCKQCNKTTAHYGSNGNCKTCANKRSIDSHNKNREKRIASMSEYYKRNKDAFREYKKLYYSKNKNRILSYCKAYRGKNKDKIISYRQRPESLRRHRDRQNRLLSTK